MTVDERECRTCRWWDRYPTKDKGHCHRRAPQPESSYDDDGYPDQPIPLWPQTDGDDWCGEHEAAR